MSLYSLMYPFFSSTELAQMSTLDTSEIFMQSLSLFYMFSGPTILYEHKSPFLNFLLSERLGYRSSFCTITVLRFGAISLSPHWYSFGQVQYLKLGGASGLSLLQNPIKLLVEEQNSESAGQQMPPLKSSYGQKFFPLSIQSFLQALLLRPNISTFYNFLLPPNIYFAI